MPAEMQIRTLKKIRKSIDVKIAFCPAILFFLVFDSNQINVTSIAAMINR